MTHWLDGNIISEESKRYVSNFISIHRLRPGNNDEDAMANSDDMVEDEEVCVTKDMLDNVLETRIGGKATKNNDLDVMGDGHHMNSSEAVELGRDIWSKEGCTSGDTTQPIYRFDEAEVKKSLQNAKTSRNKENKFVAHFSAETRTEREAVLSNRKQATKEDVKEWLEALQNRRRGDGRMFVNADQFAAVANVAQQVRRELPGRDGCTPLPSEPLRWVVHGGPGTGKSHVVRDVIKHELFDQILHWHQGLDYQVIALQAVMADLLKGDTIHHACGIPVRKKGAEGDVVIQGQKAVGEQSLYWRWLIIDEFGMVGSSLLAEVDMKLRDVVVDVNPHKKTHSGHVRPFGGLNVLLSGDLWQLPPPSGGYLGNIPAEFIANARRYNPSATISHGQSLLWGGPDNSDWAFHGITELNESERCREDPWLQAVQLELREGRLSEDSHNFLHGQNTTVCGSWTDGAAACGNALCQKLSENTAAWSRIEAAELKCRVCSEARRNRCRVAHQAADPRFLEEKFVDAPAIFPNNDIKYDVNKRRARQYAATHKLGITWVQAKDKALPKTLQERPDLVLQKTTWLSRHDRECGDLYGMLPLIEGMPVALTDHFDRSPDKQLLRGKIGKIHSWKVSVTETSVWEEDTRILHEIPEVVYVKFPNCIWHIEGTPEPGIYPITKVKRHWYLDKSRQYPQLGIQREQLPLAPAFSWTAHTAQGQTLDAAIVDMQIGAGTSPMASYVAFTRVKKMKDLLIFRPFDRALFNRGNLEGPELLLRVLRGERIDWEAVERKHMPSHMCIGCDTKVFKEEFSEREWKRKDGKHLCKTCEKAYSCNGEKKQCQWCGDWHPENMFDPKVWRCRDPSDLWCDSCKEKRQCRGECGEMKALHEFTVAEWKQAAKLSSQRGRCRKCENYSKDVRLCSVCKERLNYKTRKCDKCSQGVETRQCTKCKKHLTQLFFGPRWCKHGAELECYECCTAPAAPSRKWGEWQCIRHGCKKTLPKEHFSLWMENNQRRNGRQVCNQCLVKHRQDEKEQNKQSNKHVQKHHSETHSKKK